MFTSQNVSFYYENIVQRIDELTKQTNIFSKTQIYEKLPHLRNSPPLFLDIIKEHQKTLKSFSHLGWAIDHTLLKSDATKSQISSLCQEAINNNFYAVCVNGSRVETAVELCKGSNVVVAGVVGFPLGASTSSSKVHEARELITLGCSEIDMVINIGRVKDRDYIYVHDEIAAVAALTNTHNKVLKVILECGALTKEEIIDTCIISVLAGAQFVKTSTGFGPGGAKLEDVQLMKSVVGLNVLVKASGGIKTYKDACDFLLAGASRIGTSSGLAIFRSPSVDLASNKTNSNY